jgi:hypothetical protein
MDNIIINNQLVNKEQITKIRYEMEYDKISGILYTINSFLCYYKDDRNNNHKRYIRSDGRWGEGNIEGEELKKMYHKIQKSQAQTDFIKSYGRVNAYIELSSGTEMEVNIFEFRRERWFNWFRDSESAFPVKEDFEGKEFNPEDICIEYVCDLVFKNKKHNNYKATRKEI